MHKQEWGGDSKSGKRVLNPEVPPPTGEQQQLTSTSAFQVPGAMLGNMGTSAH